MSVPNQDLWSETIQDRLRGQIDFKEVSYQGDAYLAILNEGEYTFDFPQHTHVELNGNDISAGDVHLKKGAYAVRVITGTHGGPFILGSYLRITRKGTDQVLPLVNSGADIKRFLAKSVAGVPVGEVSGYLPTVADVAVPDVGKSFHPSTLEGMDSVHEF